MEGSSKEGVKFCVRSPSVERVTLRIHYRGILVTSPVKWYVSGVVSEMNWEWNMSYMQLHKMITSECYKNIKCLWYWDPKFCFTRGLRPLNNDADILKFAKDVKGFDLVDVYVEHTIDEPIVEDIESDHSYGLQGDSDEVNDAQGDDEVDCAEGDDVDDNGIKVDDMQGDESVDDADYVASGGEDEHDNFLDSDIEVSQDSVDIDWITVLPSETLGEVNQSMINTRNANGIEDEFYEDSDVLNTPPGSDDEEEEPERFPRYKEGIQFQLGMMFNNKNDIRDAIKEYAMWKRKNVFITKNDAKRIVVKCMKRSSNKKKCMVRCPFHLRLAKRVGNEYWQVVSFNDHHNCPRTPNNRQATPEWLARKFVHTLRYSPDIKPIGLQDEAVDKWGVKVTVDTAYRSKRMAMDLIQGAGREQFSHLRSYAQELLRTNPNSTCIIQCADSSQGDYGGQLMAAVGKDGNNQIFPIAYAVVEAETKDSWKWFVDLLLEDLTSIQYKPYAFISYQQKAARATTIPAWQRAMQRMKKISESAWNEVREVRPEYWTRSHFKTYTQCDLQVNNMCEAFNRAILGIRDKPIITLLEGIKHYLTKRFGNQNEMILNYNGSICPEVQKVIEKEKKAAAGWIPTWHHDDELDIFGVTNGTDTYNVNLKMKTCACRKWDLTGIPCCHAIACIWQNKVDPEDYVAACYRKSTFIATYSHIIMPSNGPQMWPLCENMPINPPVMRRAIGRPKKNRNKANDEPRNPNLLPRKFATVTCKRCGGMGHNKRSCKGKRAADGAIPKGGNQVKKQKSTHDEAGTSKTKGKKGSDESGTSKQNRKKSPKKPKSKKSPKKPNGKKAKTGDGQTEIGQGSQAPLPTQD